MTEDRLNLLSEFSKDRIHRNIDTVTLHGNDVDELIAEVKRLRQILDRRDGQLLQEVKKGQGLRELLKEARPFIVNGPLLDAECIGVCKSPGNCECCTMAKRIDAALGEK
jgi:hypothetical protein